MKTRVNYTIKTNQRALLVKKIMTNWIKTDKINK